MRAASLGNAVASQTLVKLCNGFDFESRTQSAVNGPILSIWWPGLSTEINDFVKRCGHCQERRSTQRKEPLKSTPLPQYPWQNIGCDICEVKGSTYIVMVDYYSRYIEIAYIRTPTTHSVILKMKDVFARWGVPETVVSDNGPQFASREFSAFATSAQFIHQTSSPHYPVSNGEAERVVQTATNRMRGPIQCTTLISSNTDPVKTVQSNPVDDGKTNQNVITDHHIIIRSTLACAAWRCRNDETAKATYTRDYNKRNGVR